MKYVKDSLEVLLYKLKALSSDEINFLVNKILLSVVDLEGD